MNDDQLDRLLRAERDQVPPAAPRDAMWEAITARRQGAVVPLDQARRRRPRLYWPVGIAALLAIGFALGRGTRNRATPIEVAGAPAASNGISPALAGATMQHLNRTETFLTGFRMEAGTDVPDTTLVSGARELLSTTRLLLDSPGQSDPRTRALLEELETVLVQVAQLRNEPSDEAKALARQLDEQGVLPRLRVSIPAGPAGAIIIGES
jgi:hypothetical protein